MGEEERTRARETKRRSGRPSRVARSRFGWLCDQEYDLGVAYRNISLTAPQLAFSVEVPSHHPSMLDTYFDPHGVPS